jgi:hypothetical protein
MPEDSVGACKAGHGFPGALGSTRLVISSTGATCFDTDYYPYGQETDHTATCPPTNRFTGYEYDSETWRRLKAGRCSITIRISFRCAS